MADHPEDRTLLAVDIEGFGQQGRTNPTRLRLRRQLARWCAALLKQAGASPSQWCVQDTGDGFIFSVDSHIPRNLLLSRFVAGLPLRLSRYNRHRPETERIRLRFSMHAGDVLRDPEPIHGEATVLACRLLDASVLRACLAATEQPMAAIVSETIYDNIVKHAFPPIDPGTWYPVVAVIKEGPKPAWVHVPGDYLAPSRAGVVHQRQSA
jgi:class 3 adenylate cyclase